MMRARYALARKKATDLLQEATIVAPPVPVEKLAKLKGAVVRYEPFQGQMSGLLYKSKAPDQAVIGVNALDPGFRQRFTIAHELGHLLLHEDTELQVDQHAFLAFRDPKSSSTKRPKGGRGESVCCDVANAGRASSTGCFLIWKAIRILRNSISKLAQQFGVSEQAMTIRLTEPSLDHLGHSKLVAT